MLYLFQFAATDEDAKLSNQDITGNNVVFYRYTSQEVGFQKTYPPLEGPFWMFGEHGGEVLTGGNIRYSFNPHPIKATNVAYSQERVTGQCTVTVERSNEVAQMFKKDFPNYSIWFTLFCLESPTAEPRVLFVGRVRSCDFEELEAKLTISSIEEVLGRPGCHRKFTRQCPYSIYDADCGIDKQALDSMGFRYRIDGFVSWISEDGLTVMADAFEHPPAAFGFGGGEASSFLSGGVIIFNGRYNGDPAGYEGVHGMQLRGGVKRMIDTHATGEIILVNPVFDVNVGDLFTAYRGCPKTVGACKGTFNNFGRFGGWPNIPDRNPFESGLE